MRGAAAEHATRVPNGHPEGYLEAFAQAWLEIDLEDWRTWLTWRVVRSRAPYLPEAVVAENFDFYGRTLTGAQEMRERLMDEVMDETFGLGPWKRLSS